MYTVFYDYEDRRFITHTDDLYDTIGYLIDTGCAIVYVHDANGTTIKGWEDYANDRERMLS